MGRSKKKKDNNNNNNKSARPVHDVFVYAFVCFCTLRFYFLQLTAAVHQYTCLLKSVQQQQVKTHIRTHTHKKREHYLCDSFSRHRQRVSASPFHSQLKKLHTADGKQIKRKRELTPSHATTAMKNSTRKKRVYEAGLRKQQKRKRKQGRTTNANTARYWRRLAPYKKRKEGKSSKT